MTVATSPACALEIHLFGEPAAYAHGTLQNLKLPAKSLELLCALALNAGQAMDRAKLAFTLWPDETEDEAKAKLRRHLYLLTRAIASVADESQLQATSTTLTWMANGPTVVDVAEFIRLGDSPDTQERAAALYTGELLSTLYEDWLQTPRERLRQQQLAHLVALSNRCLHSDAQRALLHADAALRIDSWSEEALRCVMFARTYLGDRAGAVHDYNEFEHRLREEFDSEPSPETKRALQTAKAGELETSNLPRQLTSFVGRETVVKEIKSLLERHQLVTLVGTGGAGKTRCAIQIGADLLDRYSDGVWLVELAPITDPSHVAGVIARALNVQESHHRPILETLVLYLRRKQLLLIVDNCEHVIDETRRVVAEILSGCPDVRILATSREGLVVAGDQIYRMPSLTVPPAAKTSSAFEVLEFGAPQLFYDRAQASDNRFCITDENASHVADICRRLDGIPLAIELAAARVNVLSPKELDEKLDERFRVLTDGNPTALPRHQTMRALIDWSYDLLCAGERKLFRKLSIFAGGFTLATASAVCSETAADEIITLNELSSLVDKSLVQADAVGDGTRYRMLESVRQYARECLADSGEYAAAARAHATAFLALAEDFERVYEMTPDRTWASHVEPEMENWRTALAWSLEDPAHVVVGQRLAGALRWAWFFFAPAEGRKWVRSALRSGDGGVPDNVRAKLDLAEAQLNISLIQYKASCDAAERALLLLEPAGDQQRTAEARWVAGRANLFLLRCAEGEEQLLAARQASEHLNQRKLTCWIFAALAYARTLSGDREGARAYYDEALTLAKEIRFQRMVAVLAGMLAEEEFRAGNASAAVHLVGEAIDVARMLHDNRSVVTDLCNMSAYLTSLGRYSEARLHAREVLRLSCDAGFEVLFAFTLQHLAATVTLRPFEDTEHHRADLVRAAHIVGHVDANLAALESSREYTEQQEYDKMLPLLRSALGEADVAKFMTDGAAWSEERAFAAAMHA